jgi:hypothetical protein
MNRKLLIGLALAVGPLLWTSAANADMIGIGGATGSITFTSNGDGTISFSTAGFNSASPLATFQHPTGVPQDFGSATFSAMSGATGLESGGLFPITSGGTETVSYTGTTDSLSGTVTWPDIKDGTTSPQFDVNAFLTVGSRSGDATFLSDFPVGSKAEIDFTVTVPTTLTDLAGMPRGATVVGSFSSGEIVPDVPEPASLTLLGSALFGLGMLGRRRAKLA